MGYKCIQKSQWFILPYVTIWSGPEAAAPPACKLPVGTLHAQICGRPQPRPTWARSWQGSPPCISSPSVSPSWTPQARTHGPNLSHRQHVTSQYAALCMQGQNSLPSLSLNMLVTLFCD
jgi:hypothetical protein